MARLESTKERCPVCAASGFEPVREMITGPPLADALAAAEQGGVIVQLGSRDSSAITGKATGFCDVCGGVVHGWIFAGRDEVDSAATLLVHNMNTLKVARQMALSDRAGGDVQAALATAVTADSAVLQRGCPSAGTRHLLLTMIEGKAIGLQQPLLARYASLRSKRTTVPNVHTQVREILAKVASALHATAARFPHS